MRYPEQVWFSEAMSVKSITRALIAGKSTWESKSLKGRHINMGSLGRQCIPGLPLFFGPLLPKVRCVYVAQEKAESWRRPLLRCIPVTTISYLFPCCFPRLMNFAFLAMQRFSLKRRNRKCLIQITHDMVVRSLLWVIGEVDSAHCKMIRAGNANLSFP